MARPQIRAHAAQGRIERGNHHAVRHRLADDGRGAREHGVHSRLPGQPDVVELQRLLKRAIRLAGGERMLGMHDGRQGIAAMGAGLESFQIRSI